MVHCDRSKAPVFLRFLNMMINDATVQLDEGLEVGVVWREHFFAGFIFSQTNIIFVGVLHLQKYSLLLVFLSPLPARI